MDILLTNHTVSSIGGSENWNLTMAKAFQELGHNVRLRTFDNSSRDGVATDDGREYDLAIVSHHDPCSVEAGKTIFVSHGIIGPEQPRPGADHYVAVSEEVQDYWSPLGTKPEAVIRQPIDTKHFYASRDSRNLELKRIMVMSNNRAYGLRTEGVDLMGVFTEALKGYQTMFVGRDFGAYLPDIRDYIVNADLVITLSRGIFETLAMVRSAMIADIWGVDGMVTEESIAWQRRGNCAGRMSGQPFTADVIREELENYDPTVDLRDYVLREHEATTIAQQFLDLVS